MFEIMNYCVLSQTAKIVPYPTTYGLRHLAETGRANNALLIMDHSFNKAENPDAQERWEHIVDNGIDLNGVHYVYAFAGSGQIRKGMSTFIDESIKDEFLTWLHCGVDTKHNQVINKVLVYDGMSAMSATKPWEQAFASDYCFGLMEPIDIDRVAIMDDATVDFTGIFDVIENDVVTRKSDFTVSNKFTDGANLYIVNDDGLNPKQREILEKSLEDFTFRAPGFKGLAHCITKSALRRFVIDRKCGYTIKDHYGVVHNIFDMQLISFVSTFKWSKSIDSFSIYQDAFKAMGHAFSVCVTAHKKLADLPYQQLQTLTMAMSEQDGLFLAQRSAAMMTEYEEPSKAATLIGGDLGRAAYLWPNLLLDDYSKQEAQKGYTSKRHKISGGRAPRTSYNPFAYPDTVAVLEHIFGLEVKGTIAGKTVICKMFDEAVVDVTRCPHLDNAHCLRMNRYAEKQYHGLFCGSTAFFSIHDATMNTLQMDYDGDHVNITAEQFIVSKAMQAIKATQNVPLYYEAKGSKPGEATDAAARVFLKNLEPAPVGLYANTLTKVWAFGMRGEMDKQEVALLTEGGNTCIDAAKYIAGNNSDMASGRALAIIDKYSKVKKPYFLAYAKSSAFVDGSFEEAAKGCVFYNSSFLDHYVSDFRAMTPDNLIIHGLEGLKFDYKMLCDKSTEIRRMDGLCKMGTREANFTDAGFFNQLAFRTAAEWEDAERNGIHNDVRDELKEEFAQRIRTEVLTYGEQHGFSVPATINSLIMSVYTIKSAGATQVKRALWSAFGAELLQNLQDNLADIGEQAMMNLDEIDFEDDLDTIEG